MTITIHCPSCDTGFPVDPAKIPEAGVKVRCAVCSHIFRVERPAPEPAPEPVEETIVPPAPESDTTSSPDGSTEPEPESDGQGAPPEPPAAERETVRSGWDSVPAPAPTEETAPEPSGWDAVPDPEPATEMEAEPTGWDATPDPEPTVEETPAEPSGWDAVAGPEPATETEAEPTGWDAVPDPDPVAEAEPQPSGWEAKHDSHADADTEDDGGWGTVADDDWGSPSATDAPTESEGTDPSPANEDPDSWVIEVEEDIDPNSLDVERVGTVEETVEEAQSDFTGAGEAADTVVPGDEGAAFDGYGMSEEAVAESPIAHPGEPKTESTFGTAEGAEVAPDVPVDPPVEPEAEAPAEETPPAAPIGFQFGKRDPHEKAKRLARVLVSDMITYNPERHRKALDAGTLKEDFEEEIEKSWKEYVEQVGAEMAQSNTYWRSALNEILAGGDEVF